MGSERESCFYLAAFLMPEPELNDFRYKQRRNLSRALAKVLLKDRNQTMTYLDLLKMTERGTDNRR